MDVTVPNLKPGKHRVLLKYSDPFSVTDSSFSNALFIETPKAIPFISNASFKPTVTIKNVNKIVPISYSDIVTNMQRASNKVTLFTKNTHAFINSSRITLSNLGADLDGNHTVTGITNTKTITFNKTGTAFLKNETPQTITSYVSTGTRTITATSSKNHGLIAGRKIKISGATGAQQTKLNGTWTVASAPTTRRFTFLVTTAPTSGTYSTNIGTFEVLGNISYTKQEERFNYKEAKISIPEKLKDSLEWTNTLRDVVFFLYQVGTGPFIYVDSDIRNGGSNFTTTPPAYPSLKNKRANVSTILGSQSYKFSYVIVRYYKNSAGNWIGYFPMLKKDSVQVNTINDIIVSAVGV
jgi:hypothetical protein